MYITIRKKVIVSIMIAVVIISGVLFGKDMIVSGVKMVSASNKILPIYSVGTEESKISFGFNCAWESDDIDDYIELFDKYNVKCTFFILGTWAEANPDCVEKLYKSGHEIGSHGFSHKPYDKMTKEQIIDETKRSMELLESITGEMPKLIRFPSGAYNDLSVETVKEMGYTPIQWNIDSRDWQNKTKDEIIDNISKNAEKGSIIIVHTAKQNTFDAMKELLPLLKESSVEIVPVGELIYTENYVIDHSGKQIQKTQE
ncbi:MAG: polysaccharide deacetylase family protein [Oscillospiraceae bacterium]